MRWCVCLLVLLLGGLLPLATVAEEVRSEIAGFGISAKLQIASDEREVIYLVLHGTWAHNEMEIVRALQDGLSERSQSSIAPNLSLGVDSRRGFLPCASSMAPNYEHAVLELKHWVDYLREEGWQSIVLVGHSRGGAQVTLFQLRYNEPLVRSMALLAPMVWREAEAAAQYERVSTVSLPQVLSTAQQSTASNIGPFRLLQCDAVSAPASTFQSYYDASIPKNTALMLQQVSIPVQVFAGSDDAIAQWSDAERAQLSNKQNIQYLEIEGADHFFRDLYLDDVLDLMLSED
ncbi:MAG: alpha/beta hydrolase [Pseudomonadales bacterium]